MTLPTPTHLAWLVLEAALVCIALMVLLMGFVLDTAARATGRAADALLRRLGMLDDE